MAIEKKSLISNNKATSTKSTSKATPSSKLQTATALRVARTAHMAKVAIHLGKSATLAKSTPLKTTIRF